MGPPTLDVDDFAEPGQLSLNAMRHVPTLDIPATVGRYQRRDRGTSVVAWSDGHETVEVIEVRTPDGRDYETIATADGMTSTIAIEASDEAAIAAAVRYMGEGTQ